MTVLRESENWVSFEEAQELQKKKERIDAEIWLWMNPPPVAIKIPA